MLSAPSAAACLSAVSDRSANCGSSSTTSSRTLVSTAVRMTVAGAPEVLVDREVSREAATASPFPEYILGHGLRADELALLRAKLDERSGSEAEPLANGL